MTCKYNNSLYAEPPEVEENYSRLEQLMLLDDYETPEERDYRLNNEYFQVYFMDTDEMLAWSEDLEKIYGGK